MAASWRNTNSTNGRSTNRVQRSFGERYRHNNEMGTSSVHDNLDEYCRNNLPLGQSGRANSTLNGIARRSSDQTHQNAYSYEKRRRKEDRMQQRLKMVPDQSTLSAEDEFFTARPQANRQNISPFAKDRCALPSYASVYSNDGGLQHGEFLMNERRGDVYLPQNDWSRHDDISHAPKQLRTYPSSRSIGPPIRETIA